MLNKTRAIVLHHVKYGDSSLIVTLYSERYGRIACMVNGARSKKSRFPVTLFQPLSILDADFYYRQSREVQRLKEAGSAYIYQTVPYSNTKSAVALFLAEVLNLSLREEENNPLLFSFIFHALQLFDHLGESTSWFHHWFMIHLTRYLGFFPQKALLDGKGIPMPEMDAFSMLTPGSSDAFTAILTSPQRPPELLPFKHRERQELLDRIIRYYGLHIDGFARLKSWAVLQEVFREGLS